MPRNSSQNIYPPTDAQLIDALAKVAEIVAEEATIRINLRGGLTREVPATSPDSDDTVKQVREADGSAIDSASLQVPNGSVNVSLSGGPNNLARLEMSLDDRVPDKKHLAVILSMNEAFRPFVPSQGLAALDPQWSALHQEREAALVKLESLADQILRRMNEYRDEINAKYENRREDLERQYEENERQLKEELARDRQSLQEHKAQLDERERNLDDRSSTHARRQIRQDLKKTLADRGQRFALTLATSRKRWLTHGTFLLLLSLLAWVTWVFYRAVDFSTVAAEPNFLGVFSVVRMTITAAAFAAALIYYIRWNDRWAEHHASEEFRLKRLELDVDRANWLVEMALEWKEEKGSEIPGELLASLSANLFEEEKHGRATRHPAEDFASAIARAASRLRLELPGGLGELTLDRRGMKKLEREFDDLDGT